MIKHIWSVLSRESIINQDNNNLNIHDVLEALQVGLKPASEESKQSEPEAIIPINYEVTSFFYREEKDKEIKFSLEIAIFNPKKIEIGKYTQEITMPMNMKRMRTRIKFSGLRVQESGDYIFKILIKEEGQKLFKEVSEIPLEVAVSIEN